MIFESVSSLELSSLCMNEISISHYYLVFIGDEKGERTSGKSVVVATYLTNGHYSFKLQILL